MSYTGTKLENPGEGDENINIFRKLNIIILENQSIHRNLKENKPRIEIIKA